MCGIAGIWYWDGRLVSPDELSTMITVMHHRGPDDAGTYLDGSLGLGHRRLSIIDLSSAGHQPMANEDEALWLTYNGEIYNYRELLPSLLAQGHRFRSRTDSEVILHAFESYGVECVHQFNGMWALALWDTRARRLFLSRDRFGIKPLYYYWDEEKFIFASEIKALVAAFPALRRPNYPYIYHFLPSGALDDGEETFFAGVRSLLPGHNLVVETGKPPVPYRYWDLEPERLLADQGPGN